MPISWLEAALMSSCSRMGSPAIRANPLVQSATGTRPAATVSPTLQPPVGPGLLGVESQ